MTVHPSTQLVMVLLAIQHNSMLGSVAIICQLSIFVILVVN